MVQSLHNYSKFLFLSTAFEARNSASSLNLGVDSTFRVPSSHVNKKPTHTRKSSITADDAHTLSAYEAKSVSAFCILNQNPNNGFSLDQFDEWNL